MAETLREDNFDTYVQKSEIPVLVDFFNDGCIPCRRIAPLLSRAEKEFDGRISFAKVNAGLNRDLSSRCVVEAAPTLIAFYKGIELGRLRGTIDAAALNEFLNKIEIEKEKVL